MPRDEPEQDVELIDVLLDYGRRLLVMVSSWKWVISGTTLALLAVYSLIGRADSGEERSRLAAGDSVVVQRGETAFVEVALGSDRPGRLLGNTQATVVLDAIPDPADATDYEGKDGLGAQRPVQIRVESGELMGEVVTILRGDLRRAE